MGNTYNFDQFWEEKNGKKDNKTVTIENKEWEIKNELPAEAALKFLQMLKEKDEDDIVMIDEITDAYTAIMGEDNFSDLLKTGIGTSKLFGLLQYIMSNIYDIYGKDDKEDEDKGKEKAQQAKK